MVADQETGILSMPAEQYHAAAGVSKSMLDIIAESTPLHLWHYMHVEKPEPTPAMRLGSIVHRAILEPDTMAGAFVTRPEGLKFTTKEGKAWKEEQTLPILEPREADQIKAMVDAVRTHPVASKLLDGDTERSLFAVDGEGTLRKARLDCLTKGNCIPDVKTCASAHPDEFEKVIFNYRYFVQAAYYIAICKLLGIDKSAFAFIAVEKTPPYAVAVYNLGTDAIEAGRVFYQRDLAIYRRCVETNTWPGYPNMEAISLPEFAMKRLENLI